MDDEPALHPSVIQAWIACHPRPLVIYYGQVGDCMIKNYYKKRDKVEYPTPERTKNIPIKKTLVIVLVTLGLDYS